MSIQLTTDGNVVKLSNVRAPDPIPVRRDLGPSQIEYLVSKGWIDRRRFVPMERT